MYLSLCEHLFADMVSLFWPFVLHMHSLHACFLHISYPSLWHFCMYFPSPKPSLPIFTIFQDFLCTHFPFIGAYFPSIWPFLHVVSLHRSFFCLCFLDTRLSCIFLPSLAHTPFICMFLFTQVRPSSYLCLFIMVLLLLISSPSRLFCAIIFSSFRLFCTFSFSSFTTLPHFQGFLTHFFHPDYFVCAYYPCDTAILHIFPLH